jgi:hypothetical protein
LRVKGQNVRLTDEIVSKKMAQGLLVSLG